MKKPCRVSPAHRAFVTLVNKAPATTGCLQSEASLSSLSRRATTGGGARESKLAEHTSSFEGGLWKNLALIRTQERITPH